MLMPQPIAERAPQLHSLRMAVICMACAVLAALLFSAGNTSFHLTVIAMGAGVVLPVWYRWFQGRLDWFEPIHVVGVIYFLYFGLGAVWVVNDPILKAYDLHLAQYVPRAAFYCLLGQLAMLVAYFGPWRPRTVERTTTEWPTGYLFLAGVGGVGFAGYVATAVVERAFYLDSNRMVVLSPVAQLAPLFLYAWALGWLLYFSGRSTRAQRLVLLGGLVPGAALVLYLTISDKSLIMTMAGIPLIARWYGRRKIPWAVLLAMLLVLVFLVFPLYNTFRWSDPHADSVERLENSYRTLQSWGTQTYLRWSLEAFKARTALINSVAIVVRDTGRWVPYAQGRTIFMPALAGSIPRYLWPDKPVFEPGRDFGQLFRVTSYWSQDTSVAITMPGELYWNFHLPGIVVGMALFGYGVRWLYGAYGDRRKLDPVRCAVHSVVLVQLAHFHGAIAPDVIYLLRLLIIFAALRWLARHFKLVEVRDEDGSPAVAG